MRAEREDLAFRLIRGGNSITLAPKSLVPDDLVPVTVSGLTVARTIGLQWREQLDPVLFAIVADAAANVAPTMPMLSKTNKKLKKKK